MGVVLFSVAGACSRSGKTALAETLLRTLGGRAAAVKFTTTDDVFERCPRGSRCVVCGIDVPFRILEDEATLGEAGTDTARLGAAGRRVLWAIAKRGSAPAAWAAVWRRVEDESALVVEGSSIVLLSPSDLVFFVVHPFLDPSRWKPLSGDLLRRADAVVVNRPASERRAPSAAVMSEIARHRPVDDVRLADVTQPLESWAPDLAERVFACEAARPGR